MTNSQKYIDDIKILIKKEMTTKEIINAMDGHPYEPPMKQFKIKLIKTIINNKEKWNEINSKKY